MSNVVLNIPIEVPSEDWTLINKPNSPLYKYKDRINELCQKGLTVTKNELFAWCIFKDWDDKPEWYNIRQVRKKFNGSGAFIKKNQMKSLYRHKTSSDLFAIETDDRGCIVSSCDFID